jgi:hypothetical protein
MKNIFYLSVLVLGLFACDDIVEPINWDTIGIPPKLIVEGWLTNEPGIHPITLKTSGDYFSNQDLPVVTGARVSVTGNGQTYQYIEDENQPGTYNATEIYSGVQGSDYQLNIQLAAPVEETTNYTASVKLIETMRIDSAIAEMYKNPFYVEEDSAEMGMDSTISFIVLYGLEPEAIENYYMLKLFQNGVQLNDSVSTYGIFNDIDQELNGSTYIPFTASYNFADGDTITIELYSISRHFFNFVKGCQQISQPADPFGFQGPPANAVGNVNNGQALGYFVGTCVARADAIVKDMR